jgi:putative membrane protein
MKFLKKLSYLLLFLGVLALGASFAVQNRVSVPLNLLVLPPAEGTIALWVLLAFALGGITGMLTSIGLVMRLRTALLRANRQLAKVPPAPAPEPVPEVPIAAEEPEKSIETKGNE